MEFLQIQVLYLTVIVFVVIKFLKQIFRKKKKKYPWHCKSCAISREWNENNEYRDTHIRTMKEGITDETRKAISIISRRNWSNPSIRQRMLQPDRDWKTICAKGVITKRKNFLSGKTKYKVRHGKRIKHRNIFMRSTYETRFAIALDKQNIDWIYEPKCFEIGLNRTYLPDFYLPTYDLYIEVKGWWRDDALEKFQIFLQQHSSLRCALVTKDELVKLEKGELNFETCIVKAGWCPTSL